FTARNADAISAWKRRSRRPCRRRPCPPASRPITLNSPSRAAAPIVQNPARQAPDTAITRKRIMSKMIPVTILTGFLGSGKTTLLKRILTEQHGMKIAVIENEFGEENIDNDILVQDGNEQIVQMSNGCICCTIRGDLVAGLSDLLTRR